MFTWDRDNEYQIGRVYPPRVPSARRDQRLREIERKAWVFFGSVLVSVTFGGIFGYLTL